MDGIPLCAKNILTVACLVLLSARIVNSKHLSSKESVSISTSTVIGGRASLPCDVQASHPEDKVVLVLWYKNQSTHPLYSYDARSGPTSARHIASDETKKRIFFQFYHDRQIAYLEIDDVLSNDEAHYRCMVDFSISSTKNTIIELVVIEPPHNPLIYDESHELVGGLMGEPKVLGPRNEGSSLRLQCNVKGGKPKPAVSWLMNGVRFETVREEVDVDIIQSYLHISKLERKHFEAILECRASNSNYSNSLSSSVKLDMNLLPENVSLSLAKSPLRAGQEIQIQCESWGSKPSAQITWWKAGTQQLKNAKTMVTRNGRVTTSGLFYTASVSDNQKYLTCRVANPLIRSAALEEGIQLNIQYKPVLSLQLGSNLDPTSIKEGDDVYFECHIDSNPPVRRVLWLHNAVELRQNTSAGILVNEKNLGLQKVLRKNSGSYMCTGINEEGQGYSNKVKLSILYKPYCKTQPQIVYGASLHEKVPVTCHIEANPGPVTFRWTFNDTNDHLPISASSVLSEDFSSTAMYVPKDSEDYGTILCWAFNSVGKQQTPCAFSIIPAGPPKSPENCSIVNQTLLAIDVECDAGSDGGMRQTFYMEIYHSENRSIYRNMSAEEPRFVISNLQSGSGHLVMTIYSANSKGRSSKYHLETLTMKLAEKKLRLPSVVEVQTFMWFVLGAIVVIVVLVFIFVRRRSRSSHREETEASSKSKYYGHDPKSIAKEIPGNGESIALKEDQAVYMAMEPYSAGEQSEYTSLNTSNDQRTSVIPIKYKMHMPPEKSSELSIKRDPRVNSYAFTHLLNCRKESIV